MNIHKGKGLILLLTSLVTNDSSGEVVLLQSL